MQIKPLPQTPRRVDISEWNDETEAFLRPMNGFEALVFNDYFVKFYRKDDAPEERFDAGFKAALLALVDADGKPLLTEADKAAVRAASFLPFFRMFSVGLTETAPDGEEFETAKKN